MAVVIGVKQQIKTYQIMQENNNYVNINNKLSSNLIYLNNDVDTYSNASIMFRNNYEFGYINDKITIYNNQSNIFTADNSNINLYKNTQFHSNINVTDYFYTSNNTNYFKNNLKLNLNENINNSFEINYNDNDNLPVLQVFKENVYFRSSNIYTSNIYVDPNSTIYTNFIDSPNLKPVIIKNMAFAESLRLLSANIIQNISIDNNIIFANLTDYKPGTPNISTYAPSNSLLWTQYMRNNNINQTDPFFVRPNISIIKYVDKDQNAVIGGSNIVEYKISKLATSNIATLVHSVNNSGYISIGSNYNHDIPLKIKISPFSSNIFEYTNITDINNKCCCINSNGFLNIGSIQPVSHNQLTINKYSNLDNYNTDLISLNINKSQFNSNTGTITIPFINNDIYTNIIFDSSVTASTLTLYITNNFIKNNILQNDLNRTLYEDSQYTSLTFAGVITVIIKFPINLFNITKKDPDNIYVIYPINMISEPNYLNNVELNKITITKTIIDQTINLYLYVYRQTYNYSYTGKYYPIYTNFISCSNNTNNVLSISSTGNIGIGTNYIDTFNLFTCNALIGDISCKSIDNFPLKSISLCNCSINNIDSIYNASFISTNNLICSSNISSNILNNNCIINNNLSVLGSNNGLMKINAKTIYNGDTQFNDYFISIYGSNAIAINNNVVNKHPNIIINSTCANSYPFLTLKNTSNTYNISINSNNNFQITNNSNVSIIQNIYKDNNISILDTSLCIFKDVNSNVKIFMGANTSRIETYYSYISGIGKNPAIKSSINTYGNLNFCDSSENPIINSYFDVNNKLRIGIGTINTDSDLNGMVVNLSTLFSSNITAKRNILLEGTILSISDSNLKTDIKKIKDPLDKISKISGYTYTRIDTSNIETGLIAQEVINILPEVVKYENNHYNISYGNMCGLLVECIKELKDKITALEDRLLSI